MGYFIRSGLHLGFALLAASLAARDVMAQDGEAPPGTPTVPATLEEIVVTSQRREEKLQDVPISISAFTQETLDAQGVRSIDDIARLTPGVTFTRTDQRNGQASNISIRGVSSSAGASTTGIYIDDTPIQTRSLGYSSFNSYPQVFDLERVEILRGPQGTLFGAGSEGGTVRFITPQPSLTKSSAYVRSQVDYTQDGAPSYELGAAFGAPIIDGSLGFRVSAWYRRDSGWVDRVDFERATLQPTTVTQSNSNSQNTVVVRAAVTYVPSDGLSITPSIFYQDSKLHDTPFFWASLSNPDDGRFDNGNAIATPSSDRFYLPALKVEWKLGAVSLVSNTSYFNRKNQQINDYSAFEAGLWAGDPYFPPGFYAPTTQINQQNNLTEELRLQSDTPNSRINWVLGAFYSHSRQTAEQLVQDTFLPGLFQSVTGVPFNVAFGQGLVNGLYTFVADPIISRDEQIAVYGQTDIKITDKLTLTAGLRGSKTKVEATAHYEGPVVGPPVNDAGAQDEKPVTPKAGLSYKFDADNMVYATAAKGFRIGGYNPKVGLPCGGQLAGLGLFDSNGNPAAPKLFNNDTVWSYEVGSKNTLFEHRLQLSSSVYYIDWKNIQQLMALNSCGFQFVTNVGAANSRGFDLQAQAEVVDNLSLGVALGYTDAKYDQTVKAGPTATRNLVTSGDHITGSPWNAALSAQYNFKVLADYAGYARIDYQYASSQHDLVAANDPANGTYNPVNIFAQPQTSQLSARVGARWSGLDLSVFGSNLLNSDTILAQVASLGTPTLYQHSTFRPRTFGVTAMYRY